MEAQELPVVIHPHGCHLRATVPHQRAQISERLFLQQIRIFFWNHLAHFSLLVKSSETHLRNSLPRALSLSALQQTLRPLQLAAEIELPRHSREASVPSRSRSNRISAAPADPPHHPHPFPVLCSFAGSPAHQRVPLRQHAWRNFPRQNATGTRPAACARSHLFPSRPATERSPAPALHTGPPAIHRCHWTPPTEHQGARATKPSHLGLPNSSTR